ncbi:MAG: pyridoxamine 5'-phosphate oxidase family protein [Thermomicrobiales bacterium]
MSIVEEVSVIERLRSRQLTTIEEVYAINGEPNDLILQKHTSYLTPLLEQFIAAAPFFMIATSDAEGNVDVSPKGDPKSSVKILDARTMVIPDRLGNRRVDGHRNILQNPHIGLIFVVPAVEETVRVNGRAFLTDDPAMLESMQVQGKVPNWPRSWRSTRSMSTARARSCAPGCGKPKPGPTRTPFPPSAR